MAQIGANERAALDMIRMAEGTWHGGGQRGYGTQFGGGQFDWRKGHPDRVVRSGGYASAAAGAYQFMPATWQGVTKQLGASASDFSPEAQDRAALQLIRNRGVDPSKPMNTAALAKLAPEWASLPTAAGKSYYNQPVKGQKELLGFYGQRLGATPNPGNTAAAPAMAPPATGGMATGGMATGGMAANTALGSIDLDGLLSGSPASASSAPSWQPSRINATAGDAVIAQQQQMLQSAGPTLSSRRTQSRARMAGNLSDGFMQQLLALTQRPSPQA